MKFVFQSLRRLTDVLPHCRDSAEFDDSVRRLYRHFQFKRMPRLNPKDVDCRPLKHCIRFRERPERRDATVSGRPEDVWEASLILRRNHVRVASRIGRTVVGRGAGSWLCGAREVAPDSVLCRMLQTVRPVRLRMVSAKHAPTHQFNIRVPSHDHGPRRLCIHAVFLPSIRSPRRYHQLVVIPFVPGQKSKG